MGPLCRLIPIPSPSVHVVTENVHDLMYKPVRLAGRISMVHGVRTYVRVRVDIIYPRAMPAPQAGRPALSMRAHGDLTLQAWPALPVPGPARAAPGTRPLRARRSRRYIHIQSRRATPTQHGSCMHAAAACLMSMRALIFLVCRHLLRKFIRELVAARRAGGLASDWVSDAGAMAEGDVDEYNCVGTRVSFLKSISFSHHMHTDDVDAAPKGDGKSLAVFTSGGDAQGMNAALRAIVRMAIFNGVKAYAIEEGYQGLVDGGDHIKELQWASVSSILHLGGTVIGTARCREFRERSGRLKAAENLVKRGINNLAVIGGDGSLTGANLFKEEWSGLVCELEEAGRISNEEALKCSYLNVVGLVGSIDNDMCGTDMTIGTDSALHRIIEAVDCLTSTASSHQRSFILEVMGRHCGYLALMAGIAGGADWVLIPENPPLPGWEDAMCRKLELCREKGRRLSLVIISEGAVDTSNRPITSQHVKETLEKKLGHDTRITVLGHVQRGGKPSAYDRAIGCRMGAAAALTLILAEGELPSEMIGVQGNEIVRVPLMNCVKRTRAIDQAMKSCDFKLALQLRGGSFQRSMQVFRRLESCGLPHGSNEIALTAGGSTRFRFAIMNVGAPAAGTNSATRACTRLLMFEGHTVLGVAEGFEGLMEDDIHEMKWEEVDDWGSVGGSNLGTNRTVPNQHSLPEIAAKFGEYKINGLLLIGGFEAYSSLCLLEEMRSHYTAFRIPLLLIAATISNNVPGTDYSLGCDTALNVIVSACDTLRQSASASRKRVFVVETMGGYCGYLATMAGLASGADAAYIFEEKFSISDIQRDAKYLIGKFKDGLQRGVFLRNEKCSVNFTTDFITKLLDEESKGLYITRSIILGHLQQGDRPSPYDRILGVKYAAHAVNFLTHHAAKNLTTRGQVRATLPESACVLGIRGTEFKTVPFQELVSETDTKHRIPTQQWWMKLRPLISVLAKHKEHIFVGEH